MEVDLEGALTRLGDLVGELLSRQSEWVARQAEYESRISALEGEASRLREEVEYLTRRCELDATVRSLGPASGDSRQARALIARLLREIDECISLLRG